MKKRILSMMLFLTMITTISAFNALTVNAEIVRGTCGENKETDSVIWEFDDSTGTLTISGEGYMEYFWGEAPWEIYRQDIKNVVVLEGVKDVGTGAFTELWNLETIKIADTVEYFGIDSFDGGSCPINTGCPFYKNEENWTNGVLYIGKHLIATDGKKIVGDCTIKEGTRSIAGATFNYCPELVSVTIPDSVQSIGIYTFIDCPKLKTVQFSRNVKNVDFQCFVNCELIEKIELPEGVESLNNSFCMLKNLTEVVIPATLKNMKGSFYGCENIKDVFYSGTNEQWNEIVVDEEWSSEGEKEILMSEKNIFENATIHFNGKPITVKINEILINFDVQPQIIDNRTMVPMRTIFEQLGATIEWDQITRTVTAKKDDTVIKLTIDDNKLYINDNIVELDVSAKIVNNRTLVPVRAISEAFDCKVDWDAENKQVIISQ